MDNAKKIDAFVHQSFAMYGLDFKQFFNDLVDEEEDEEGFAQGGTLVELPLVVEGNIDIGLLNDAAKVLGVSPDALRLMDKEAVGIWYNRYPYFALRRSFEEARAHSLQFTGTPEEMLMAAIFSDNYNPDTFKRYNGGIKDRLISLLKEYDSVMPGCYHADAKITKLTVETNNFTSFSQIEDLATSYLSMVGRARELFYKLWDEDLAEEEIREYNFLVSVLGMRDVGYSPAKPIYYDLAKKFAPVYKREGFNDYASYIMYRGADFPALFTCKEFYDHLDLVEQVVREFPHMKAEIGKMAVLAKNFHCAFVWSDEPMPPISAAEDEYYVGLLHSFGDETPSWYHRLYVPKTEEELHGDGDYISICEKLSAPASKGGIKLPIPECNLDADKTSGIKRIIARTTGGIQNE